MDGRSCPVFSVIVNEEISCVLQEAVRCYRAKSIWAIAGIAFKDRCWCGDCEGDKRLERVEQRG